MFTPQMDPPGPNYIKPFHLFHYNRPKKPPLRKVKKIDYKQEPEVPVRLNNATKIRNKVIKEYLIREQEPYIDFKALTQETVKAVIEEPKLVPKETKTTQYRYKWIREVPVVSCRFTEHVMMYHKPPFTYEKPNKRCGQFRLRNMEIKEPFKEIKKHGEQLPLVPSILH